ncbi:hypothetical protein AWB76_04081 [Caballeronia temeraria]|uniref:Uncharacterized protein n=1 Tax=Caballeronia temeraria TaxID=1777137 RepID=A0A158BEG1_9BURK|nr:hypothetical protein [Caballeronia temeraria]SAK68280.1 hypothetical protein AWB76_04081 [Caballeronia temeraria]
MKLDKSGLLMVGAAAAVLLLVVKKTTPSGTPAKSGQAAIGSNAASWLSNAISNMGGNPVATTSTNSLGSTIGGLTLFGNGTFDAGGIYVDPGQVTVNNNTGQVTESPFSGMYNVLSPATYGF